MSDSIAERTSPLGQEYIGDFLSGGKNKIIDTVYGVRLDKDGIMMLSSKKFDNSDHIIIDGVRYVGTPNLYELIFKRVPDYDVHTEDDKRKYKSILASLVTNAHRRNYIEHSHLRNNRRYKYKYVIAPLLTLERYCGPLHNRRYSRVESDPVIILLLGII